MFFDVNVVWVFVVGAAGVVGGVLLYKNSAKWRGIVAQIDAKFDEIKAKVESGELDELAKAELEKIIAYIEGLLNK